MLPGSSPPSISRGTTAVRRPCWRRSWAPKGPTAVIPSTPTARSPRRRPRCATTSAVVAAPNPELALPGLAKIFEQPGHPRRW